MFPMFALTSMVLTETQQMQRRRRSFIPEDKPQTECCRTGFSSFTRGRGVQTTRCAGYAKGEALGLDPLGRIG